MMSDPAASSRRLVATVWIVARHFQIVCPDDPVTRVHEMPDGLLPVLIFLAIVLVYTIAKIVDYSRKSDTLWRQVDKSKLREWEDDDD